MRKFAVISGFLGSGKTSTMMALCRHSKSCAMITNDLGSKGLADDRLAKLRGLNAHEITGDCICYKNEELMETLRSLFDTGNQLIISDIPGFGVGALEHVYHGLAEKFPGECELAPFTVLVEPETVHRLQSGGEDDLLYILHTQLVEADLIALNKCDRLENAGELSAWLKEHYPQADILCISAITGENIPALYDALCRGSASMRRPDIGYGGADFTRIMDKVCEYNIQYFASVCCDSFDGNAYLLALAEGMKQAAAELGARLPHMKLLSWQPEGDYAKLDMMGTQRPVEVNARFTSPCTQLAVVINSSAFGDREDLDKALSAGIERVSQEYRLELVIYKKELI